MELEPAGIHQRSSLEDMRMVRRFGKSRSHGIKLCYGMNQDVTPPSAEGVEACQKVIGELLWLMTRTRPDLMFGVSRMGATGPHKSFKTRPSR